MSYLREWRSFALTIRTQFSPNKSIKRKAVRATAGTANFALHPITSIDVLPTELDRRIDPAKFALPVHVNVVGLPDTVEAMRSIVDRWRESTEIEIILRWEPLR